MKQNKRTIVNLIFVITTILCIQAQTIFAKYNNEISTKNNYIKDQELTYRKEENGKTLISGFKIGEKISEIVEGKFGDDYEIKIKDNEGNDITSKLDKSIATGNKIEIYEKTNVGVRGTEPRKPKQRKQKRKPKQGTKRKRRSKCRGTVCGNTRKQ